jgi:pSer/pThr/pTyr-binding forkhead associated (FHA) protein
MRLEVQIDDGDPVIYVLNKPEIYVGSSPNSDIVVSTLEVSRKHLKILIIENKCFVIDQGSTNGSYMNEARLVPGRRTEFTTFESLRLGDRVYLTLLQPNQAGTLNNKNIDVVPQVRTAISRIDSDKTRIISLKELHAAKSKKLAKKRIETANRKKAESKRIRAEKDALKRVLLLAGMWIGIGFGVNLVWQSLPDVVKKTYAPPTKFSKEILLDDEEFQNFTIAPADLLTRDLVKTYLEKLKCVTDDEVYFCDKIASLKNDKSGAIEAEGQIILFIPEAVLLPRARDFLMNHSYSKKPENMKRWDQRLIRKAMTIQFIDEQIRDAIGKDFKPKNVYLAFYTNDDIVTSIAGFNSLHYPQLLVMINEEKVTLDEDNGILYINGFDRFLTFF